MYHQHVYGITMNTAVHTRCFSDRRCGAQTAVVWSVFSRDLYCFRCLVAELFLHCRSLATPFCMHVVCLIVCKSCSLTAHDDLINFTINNIRCLKSDTFIFTSNFTCYNEFCLTTSVKFLVVAARIIYFFLTCQKHVCHLWNIVCLTLSVFMFCARLQILCTIVHLSPSFSAL